MHPAKPLAALLLALLFTAPAVSAETAPETVRALASVQEQAAYAGQTAARYGAHPDPGYLTSVAALNYTAGHVSVAVYGYLNEIAHGPLPGATEESILETGAGICGHAEIVFAQIMGQAGYQTREVEFFWHGFGHVAAEVFYSGGWHFFDPTFADYWQRGGNVLSVAQVRALRRPWIYLVEDETGLYRQLMDWTKLQDQSGMTLPSNPAASVVYP